MKKLTLIFLLIGLFSGFAFAFEKQELVQAPKKGEEVEEPKVDDKVQEKDEVGKSLFASEVVWAAVIASFLTLAGVTLSNRSNRKSLAMQLKHVAQEKEKEREQQIRKEVYIEAAEAIGETVQDILLIPNEIIKSATTTIKVGERLIQSIAKVHLVGKLETLTALTEFMGKYNQSTVPLSPYINAYAALKQEFVDLNNTRENDLNAMKELNEKHERMIIAKVIEPNLIKHYEKAHTEIKKEYDTTVALMLEKRKELQAVHSELNVRCLKSSSFLQKESFHVMLTIRKELKLELDSSEYLSRIEKMFVKQKDLFTVEKIDELKDGQIKTTKEQ